MKFFHIPLGSMEHVDPPHISYDVHSLSIDPIPMIVVNIYLMIFIPLGSMYSIFIYLHLLDFYGKLVGK